MPDILAEQLLKIIPKAAELYHRLILVVAPSGSGKTAAIQHAAKDIGTMVQNVNLELSRRMLDLTENQRPRKVSRILDDIVNSTDSNTVLLDNIEILFETSLKIDPLRLLQSLSRNKTIVAAWNGIVKDGNIYYAEPGHPEYRIYQCKDLIIVGTQQGDNNG